MAKLRKFVCYRRVDRPAYTRFSKYKQKSFVSARPVCRVVKFEMGDVKGNFEKTFHVVSRENVQIRDNALESARQTGNRFLEKTLGKTGYFFKTRIYPHHVLRENPLAAGAGADRMSTGMAHSFGKVIGIAARVKKGQELFTLRVNKPHMDAAMKALKRVASKLPCSSSIVMEQTVLH